ncbi:DUF2635 domain-containing protein [Escherichia coli]|nr:DUF2635 domain-containing protein [Kluyvera ascorbata]
MFVKPNNGLSVRCPVKGISLPKEGAEVPDNTFWRRRLSDGDVTLAKSKATAKGGSHKNEGDTE